VGPLSDIRVLDLSRVLAGPICTQTLGDLGADIIKVERPGEGDITRKWGPPYLKDDNGKDTTESTYYLSANRNKRSVTIDFSKSEGQDLIRELLQHSDILVENFTTGTLDKYGLGYEALKEAFPNLIYCSITGFGHTGPEAHSPGYDFLIQGLSGMMSITGEPEGSPQKVGISIADISSGLYATIAILAALHHREKTGEGQFIDLSLLESQMSLLSFVGQAYLTSGIVPTRLGNEHPHIVPYGAFKAKDAHIIIAVGTDQQFEKLCTFAKVPELAKDPKFATNDGRVRHRKELLDLLNSITEKHSAEYWMTGLSGVDVPCGPVNNIDQALQHPQVAARHMIEKLSHPYVPGKDAEGLSMIASPLRFSKSVLKNKKSPPPLGEHTQNVLKEILDKTDEEIKSLRDGRII
jgi:crotonobetainyl-CoA:carnitine CoA-transferase CaiB-like acyl-CoA transferase